jgi:hypothetical protein
MDETLKQKCDRLRSQLHDIELEVRRLRDHPEVRRTVEGQNAEVIAQSMLAVRHIEDARMRLGKVLQYSGDGVSIYDKG